MDKSNMKEILSVNNEQVKEVVKLHQKKYRNSTGLFLMEGYKPVFEAFSFGVEIEKAFVTPKYFEKYSFLKEKLFVTTDAVMEKISTTETSPEIVAVGKQRKNTIDEIKSFSRIALIEDIKDAGNLGTIIRSAVAFGIECLVLCGDVIDLYNPKVVRSAVGALYKIPIVCSDLQATRKAFPSHNFIATVVNHDDIVKPETINYTKPFVLMMGSEANGLSAEAISFSDVKTTIPMSKDTESLNLGVASSILFYVSMV